MSEKILAVLSLLSLILLELSVLVIIVALWFRAWLRKSPRITVEVGLSQRQHMETEREVSEGTDATKLV